MHVNFEDCLAMVMSLNLFCLEKYLSLSLLYVRMATASVF